ncbi:hypothetical protein [Sphingomonas melonis]|uniref:hypothetical protein n=1 Tax=Sphingomonas melonis TaxID=152682 RepID=UPI0036D7A917
MSRRIAESMGVPYREPQSWDCFYELILPVNKYDVRNEHYDVGFIILPIGCTRRGGSADRQPCSDDRLDTPYRDGSHAFWDSKSLSWLPIFVVAPDGTAQQKRDYHEAPDCWADPATIGQQDGVK